MFTGCCCADGSTGKEVVIDSAPAVAPGLPPTLVPFEYPVKELEPVPSVTEPEPAAPAVAPAKVEEKIRESEFNISVKTGLAGKIGLDIITKGGVSLRVKKVKEGPIMDWNKANPNQEVKTGDFIIEVNEAKGSSEKIIRKISADKTLNITMRRPNTA